MKIQPLNPLSNPAHRLRLAVLGMGLLLVVGTAGYQLLGGPEWTLADSFFMTLITISTVGYGETHPLTPAGRLFTAGLILCGLFLVAFSTASFLEFVVEGRLVRYFGRRRLERQIAALDGHWIICGYGRIGHLVGRELRGAKRAPPFVIIERDAERVAACEEDGVLYLLGDATHEETLEAAGIRRAKGLVSLVASDAENVFICLTARGVAPRLQIIARAIEERSEGKLRRAGANKVISPYRMGGHRVSQSILRPNVESLLDLAFTHHELDFELEEVLLDPDSVLVGLKLSHSPIRSELDLIVIAIKRAAGETLFNPRSDTVLQGGTP